MPKNIAVSRRVASFLKPEPGQCFQTAFRVCNEFKGSSWYVEGFIIERGQPIAHAWNDVNGMIVDAQQPEYVGDYKENRRCKAAEILSFDGELPRWVPRETINPATQS